MTTTAVVLSLDEAWVLPVTEVVDYSEGNAWVYVRTPRGRYYAPRRNHHLPRRQDMTTNTDTRPEIWKSRRQGGPTIVTDDTTAGKPLNGYVCGTYVDSGRRARLRFSTLRSSYDYRGPQSG